MGFLVQICPIKDLIRMKAHQLQLINSTYSANDAREVLFSLLNDKIKFLTYKIFSESERFGADTAHYEQRVQALRAEKDAICGALRKLEDSSCEVEIDCVVNIKVRETQLA